MGLVIAWGEFVINIGLVTGILNSLGYHSWLYQHSVIKIIELTCLHNNLLKTQEMRHNGEKA